MCLGILIMAKRNKSTRRKKINSTLVAMFKMTREELLTRKQTGGGTLRPKTPEHKSRSAQKRQAIDEQLD